MSTGWVQEDGGWVIEFGDQMLYVGPAKSEEEGSFEVFLEGNFWFYINPRGVIATTDEHGRYRVKWKDAPSFEPMAREMLADIILSDGFPGREQE